MQLRFFPLLAGFLSATGSLQAQEYKVYATVHTVENREISGYLTWGKEPVYWIDLFKAVKPSNPFTAYFPAGNTPLFYSNGRLISTPPVHLFSCRFGDIRSIELTGQNRIELEIRDGNSIALNKGNEPSIGQSLSLLTPQQEYITVRWERISRIEFTAPPASFTVEGQHPITGLVKTPQGVFKGFITWDRDEKTQESLLNGHSAQGETSIAFREIRKITKTPENCRVILQNGEEKILWGSNDVNNQNRGILINMPNIGLVTVPWGRFEEFEACDLSGINTLSYADFGEPARLSGEITAKNNASVSGILAYDLDETMNFELLNGKNDYLTYEIPLKYIRSIEPKNYKYAYITLTNGSALSLGESADVSEGNSGTLVFEEGNEVTYIPWKNIQSVVFRH
ncbi:MAG: hypothetical protein LBR65_06950 [Culturomica sp.]|jgi:hypothetical protein|nr:hypothetical protein [Culturomica sp.]